ncbi:MAG: M56 family metallopeptidase [Dehalococcoidia bacterium]|nr:M56 family metallopeptidase [Dehalococcoidia bacterium]
MLALIVAPLLTLHPALAHLYEAGLGGLRREASHPQVVALSALTIISVLPATAFLIFLFRATRCQAELRLLLGSSRPARLGGLPYRVLPSQSITVFTAGVFRPVVFVSAGAESALSTAELQAALLHELAHQRHRDVLWGLVLRAVGRAFAFLPHARALVQRASLHAECQADEFALRGGARRTDLFEAIAASSATPPRLASAGIADAAVELRLVRLVHPETPIPAQPTRGFVALAAAMALPAILAHVIAVAAAACTLNLVQA